MEESRRPDVTPAGQLPRMVTLEGDPARIGLAHGRLLAPEIRFLVGRVEHHVFHRVGPVLGIGLRVLIRALGLMVDRHIPERLREEMRGIAMGSGVPYADILLINTLDDVLNILRRLAPAAPSLGCSGFAVFGKHTRDGAILHGRNLDYHFRGTPLDDGGAVARLLLRHATVFVYRPAARAAFVSIAWPGIVGVTTAMNSEGISLGNLTSYVRGTTPNGTPAALLYRVVSEEASSLQHVGNILQAYRRTIGNNLLVGSGRENQASLFELTLDSVVEIPPEDGVLVATNHFVSPKRAQRQRHHPPAHSVARWQRLRELCDRAGIGVEDATSFLADVESARGGRAAHPFARVANEGTAVSVLFSPATRELWIGTNPEPPASAGSFQRVDVAALLKPR
jgi:hypothetical protein